MIVTTNGMVLAEKMHDRGIVLDVRLNKARLSRLAAVQELINSSG